MIITGVSLDSRRIFTVSITDITNVALSIDEVQKDGALLFDTTTRHY